MHNTVVCVRGMYKHYYVICVSVLPCGASVQQRLRRCLSTADSMCVTVTKG